MTDARDTRETHFAHFLVLGREAQAGAIRRLATVGHSPQTIAAATRLSVEQVKRILEADRDSHGAAR